MILRAPAYTPAAIAARAAFVGSAAEAWGRAEHIAVATPLQATADRLALRATAATPPSTQEQWIMIADTFAGSEARS